MANALSPVLDNNPDGTWSFASLPNLSFQDEKPFQNADPVWQSLQLWGYGDENYVGPASGAHLLQIYGIPVLPLIPGVNQTTDFFESMLPDLIASELATRGYTPLALAVARYPDGSTFGIEQVGYEYFVVVEGAYDQSLGALILGLIVALLTDGLHSAWSIFQSAFGQGDVYPSAQPLVFVPVLITAAIIAAIAAIVLIPAVRDGFSSAISKTVQALWSPITGQNPPAGGLLGALTNQSVLLLGVGIVGFLAVNFLLAKTQGTSTTTVAGAKAATGFGTAAAQIPIKSLQAATPLIRETYGAPGDIIRSVNR